MGLYGTLNGSIFTFSRARDLKFCTHSRSCCVRCLMWFEAGKLKFVKNDDVTLRHSIVIAWSLMSTIWSEVSELQGTPGSKRQDINYAQTYLDGFLGILVQTFPLLHKNLSICHQQVFPLHSLPPGHCSNKDCHVDVSESHFRISRCNNLWKIQQGSKLKLKSSCFWRLRTRNFSCQF